MMIQLAQIRSPRMVNYCHALDVLAVPYCCSLEAETNASALLLPGGGDIDPRYYREEINGSAQPDEALDEKQFALFRHFLQEGKPIFGICRGCQLINVALGGSLIQHLPDAEDHTQTGDEQDQLHEVKAAKGSIVHRLYGASFRVNSSHHQACKSLGSGLIATAFAEDGTIEAIEHESLPVFAVQWHPERTDFGMEREGVSRGRLLFDYFLSLIQDR